MVTTGSLQDATEEGEKPREKKWKLALAPTTSIMFLMAGLTPPTTWEIIGYDVSAVWGGVKGAELTINRLLLLW